MVFLKNKSLFIAETILCSAFGYTSFHIMVGINFYFKFYCKICFSTVRVCTLLKYLQFQNKSCYKTFLKNLRKKLNIGLTAYKFIYAEKNWIIFYFHEINKATFFKKNISFFFFSILPYSSIFNEKKKIIHSFKSISKFVFMTANTN